MNASTHAHADLARLLPSFGRVAVPTDADDDSLANVRRVATRLAAEHGWELVLYDRSHETWMDHPHPKGCVTVDQLDGDEWEHLRVQLRDVESAGVSVTAWLATVPSITAMVDAIQEIDIDAVLVPADPEHATLADRLLEGGDPAERLERVAHLQLGTDAPVVIAVDGDGALAVRAYEPADD